MVLWKERGGPTDSEESEEQILRALHQVESGKRVADICREYGVSEATLYVWKKKYSGLALTEPEVFARHRVTTTAPRPGTNPPAPNHLSEVSS